MHVARKHYSNASLNLVVITTCCIKWKRAQSINSETYVWQLAVWPRRRVGKQAALSVKKLIWYRSSHQHLLLVERAICSLTICTIKDNFKYYNTRWNLSMEKVYIRAYSIIVLLELQVNAPSSAVRRLNDFDSSDHFTITQAIQAFFLFHFNIFGSHHASSSVQTPYRSAQNSSIKIQRKEWARCKVP